MNILSIDTTADVCSLAVLVEGEAFVFHEERPRQHAKIVLTEAQNLIQKAGIQFADLDLVVFGRGPGSFTGIRIAASVAHGIAMSADCPIVPVSTMQSLAWKAAKQGAASVWVALDARMSEWYFGRFSIQKETGIPQLIGEEQVLPPAMIRQEFPEGTVFIGNGWSAGYGLPDSVQGPEETGSLLDNLPNALDSAELAQALVTHKLEQPVPPEDALPVYIRDNVTWDNKPKVGS